MIIAAIFVGLAAATPAPTAAPATVPCDDGTTCPYDYPVCVGHAPANHCCPLSAPVGCATRAAPRTLRHCCDALHPICDNDLGAPVCLSAPGLNATEHRAVAAPYVYAVPGILVDPGPWPAHAVPNGVAETQAEFFMDVPGGVVKNNPGDTANPTYDDFGDEGTEEWFARYGFEDIGL